MVIIVSEFSLSLPSCSPPPKRKKIYVDEIIKYAEKANFIFGHLMKNEIISFVSHNILLHLHCWILVVI